jgi:hypothetical protein
VEVVESSKALWNGWKCWRCCVCRAMLPTGETGRERVGNEGRAIPGVEYELKKLGMGSGADEGRRGKFIP